MSLLALLKVYTHYKVADAEERLEVINEFISLDLEDLTRYSDEMSIGLNKNPSYRNWNSEENIDQSDIDEFYKCLNLDTSATSTELLECFNNSELRSVIDVPAFRFTDIEGLTAEHNHQVLEYLTKSAISEKLSSQRFDFYASRIRPYLLHYREELDSMQVGIALGYQGRVNSIVEIEGIQFEIDSLPYNIGDVKGEVRLSYKDSRNNTRWRRNEF